MNQEIQAPPKKKSSVLWWILGGCGVVVVLGVLVFVIVGFVIGRKIASAKNNPAVLAAEMMVRANPELELVNSDYDKGTLTVRNKKTGETLTMDASGAEKGQFRFRNEKGEEVTIAGSGSGESGTMHIQTKDGEATFGAGTQADLPSWAPSYPGATADGVVNTSTDKIKHVTVIQKTGDSVKEVLDFFESQLKGGGFKATTVRTPEGGMVNGEDKANRRVVSVMVGREGSQTTATVSCREGDE